MTKTNEEMAPDQPSARTLNDENRENENSVNTPSKISNEMKPSSNIPKIIQANSQEKNKVNQVTTTVVTLKSHFVAECSSDNNLTKSTIAVASTEVIDNNRITTHIPFKFRHPKDAVSFNVAQAHKNIYSSMKMIDETIKFVTFDNKTTDSIDQFPDNQNYITTFKNLYRKKNWIKNIMLTRLNRLKRLANSNKDLEIDCQEYLTTVATFFP